jgi:acetyl-CoA acetyltransferase
MSRKAAIVGLGLTPMSLKPGPEAAQLAGDAITRALTDAGMTRGDVDGLLVNSSQGIRPDRVGVALARHDGFGDLALLEHIEIKGATAAAMIQRAVLAIEAGLASTVVCVFADAPIQAGGTSGSTFAQSGGNAGVRGLERASGQLGSVPTYALLAARYLHRVGGSENDLCAVALAARAWAAGNPEAVGGKPLTREDYFASRMISTPLRVLDCARPVNGAGAVVVSMVDRSSSVQPPVFVNGMSQFHPMRRRRGPGESWFSESFDFGGTRGQSPRGESFFGSGARPAVDAALDMAKRTRADLDVHELYDPFSVVTLCLLEDYGLVEAGSAGEVVRSGATGPGGSLPTNTGGGQLAGFYLQGMTPLAEGIIQLRGTGGARQVPDASTALVTGIGGRVDHHAVLVLDREAA